MKKGNGDRDRGTEEPKGGSSLSGEHKTKPPVKDGRSNGESLSAEPGALCGEPVGKEYWRSLDELADDPRLRAFAEQEFPSLAEDLANPATRRHFLKILGASLGMAGLAACRWPKELIVPFANRPDGRTPGVAQQYATAMELLGVAVGLLVTSHDGRPTKIEGNPLHPASRGAASMLAQASVLELYDPDRSQQPIRRDTSGKIVQTWDAFAAFASAHFSTVRAQGGKGFAVLGEASSSPSVAALRSRLLAALPSARWFEYEPVSRDNEREGTALLFAGEPVRPQLHLDRADVILALDADFLGSHPAALAYAADFAAGRRANDGRMNRLYVAEAALSLTGAAADHRLPVPATRIVALAAALIGELQKAGRPVPPDAGALAEAFAGSPLAGGEAEFVRAAARDLAAVGGRGVVLAGWRQGPLVHAAAALLNRMLGAVGSSVTYSEDLDPQRPTHRAAIAELAGAMREGAVSTLLIIGGNPVFDAPADLAFGAALAKVDTAIHLALYDDETSNGCRWHVPRAHYLESWGDGRAWDGTISVVQPLIAPLYDGKTAIELLAVVLGEAAPSSYDIVRETLRPVIGGTDFERSWRRVLNDGVVKGSAFPPPQAGAAAKPAGEGLGRLAEEAAAALVKQPAGLELVFAPDECVFDGRFANNPWLQEVPSPLTRLTWDNAALASPATAASLGVSQGDVVALSRGGRTVEVAVYVLPGVAESCLVLPLGYGREAAGRVGNAVGVNAYALRTSDGMNFAGGVSATRNGRWHDLVTTQDHHTFDLLGMRERGRRVGATVREGTLEEYKRNPDFTASLGEAPRSKTLFNELKYTAEHQWGMAIDLTACIGCNACAVACQAENNIPVVGRDQVSRGREMHWIRVDRYFSGKPKNAKVLFQPVACQQCETAPCEEVCPVAATMHSEEGLNQMVYNRCIGTRYCSNNCPYKVRRFNFFNYFLKVPQVRKMVYNPEVTIRSRGVMEKCTFCIQRIEAVKIAAKNDRRTIRDGEITPACAQTCPTTAIVFGDLRDPNSRVAELHRHDRAYSLLAELDTQPRNVFLSKLRNPSPDVGEGG
jgi:MoCo/4Fe-4S cofactor protein with predicted Tat translocation signal